MNKSEYSFGIFAMILTLITGFLYAGAYIGIGAQVFFLDVYGYYFLISNIIYFSGTAILAKHFYQKGYNLPFIHYCLQPFPPWFR